MAINKLNPAVKPQNDDAMLRTHKKSQGFAVVFVLAFIALLITIVGDIVYQTQIVSKNVMESQNQLQAQGTALSGMSIGKVLIKLHNLATSPEIKKLPLPITLPTTLYSSLNGIPIGQTTILENPTLAELIDPNLLTSLKNVPGYFVLNISSENCKLNLNLLQIGSPYSEYTKIALNNLFSTPDAQSVLGIYNLTATTMVDNLIEYFRKIKRPLSSVQELRLVDGFQYDDIYNIYSSYFTVWPSVDVIKSPPLNINCAPIELIASILRPSPQTDINPVLWKNFETYRDNTKFTEIKKLKEWFDKNAKTWMNDNIKKMLEQMIGFKDNTYRIDSKGNVNKTEQKLTVVIRMDETGTFITEYNQWSH